MDVAQSIIASFALGSLIIGVSFYLKKTNTMRQFLSLFSLGAILIASGISRVTLVEGDQSNPGLMYQTSEEVTLYNAQQTETLGSYRVVTTDKTMLTQEELLEFYQDMVQDSNHDWVTLVLGNHKGLMFPDSSASFMYGVLDEQHCVTDFMGMGLIVDNTVEYQFN